jgi:hypothetical protein
MEKLELSAPWNDEGGGNTVYFDRHTVKCKSNEALSRLKLSRKGDGNFRFDYTCCASE